MLLVLYQSNLWQAPSHSDFLLFSGSSTDLGFTFKSIISFEWGFVCGVDMDPSSFSVGSPLLHGCVNTIC